MRFLLALALLIGCTNPPPPMAETTTTTATPTPTPTAATRHPPPATPRVLFPDGYAVRVEIAADSDSRAQGLMYRDRLEPGTGMLFLFPQDDRLAFWMKNTRIPLDMIFLDANGRIVGIEENVPPCKFDPCPSYGPDALARYVLEVAGGVAREHGLKTGDVLRFEGTERFVAR